jgi:PAS domain S-box-containing protein
MRSKRGDSRKREMARVLKIVLLGAAVLFLLACTAVDLAAHQTAGGAAQSGDSRPADGPIGAQLWGWLTLFGLLGLLRFGWGKGDRQGATEFTDACRFLFEESPAANIILSSDGIIKELNRSGLTALGHAKRSQLIGRSILDLVTPEHKTRLTRLLKESDQESPGKAEVDLSAAGGGVRTFLLSGCRLKSSDKESPGAWFVGMDVTDRRLAREDVLQPTQDLEFLSETAVGFLELSPQEDVHRYIGERLKQLVRGAVYIVVNSVDRELRKLQVRCLLGGSKLIDLAVKTLGRDPAGMSFDVHDEAWQGLAGGRLVMVPGGIYELAFRQVPKSVCSVIEKLANLGDIYVMGFAAKNEVYGSAAIILRRGAQMTNRAVIETFIRQAGVALQRRKAEEALRKEREKLEWATENAGVGLIMISRDYRTLWANQVIKRTFGEVEGKPCYLSYHRRAEVCPGCGVKELLETGKDQVMREQAGKDKAGKTIWSQIVVTPIKDAQGSVAGALEAVVPITERKQSKQLQGVLYRIANAANTAGDSDGLFRIIREELMSVLDTTNFFVALYDRKTGSLSLPYHVDQKDRFTSLPPEKTLTAWILRNDSPLLCTPEVRKRLVEEGEIEPTGTPSLTWLGVPLKVESETIGVLGVQSYSDASAYGTKELETLQFASGQIALAIRRKQAEEALRRSEKDYRGLFEGAHDAILIFEPETETILDVNRRACEVYGFERSEFVGMSLEEISQDVPTGKKHIQLTLDKGKYHRFQTVQYRKDGSQMFLEVNASVVDYMGRQVILSINRDVTERMRTEEALRGSEERFRIASQIASDVVYERDLKTGIATFYGDIDSPLGYEPGGYPHTMEGWRNHVHPEDLARIDNQSLDQTEPGVPYGIEYRMRKKDGTYMTWSDRIMIIRDKKTGEPLKFIGAATDITERKQTEEALRLSEARLKRAQAMAHIGNWDWDIKENTLVWSEELYRIFGVKQTDFEFSFEAIENLLHPEDRDLNRRYVKRLLDCTESGEYAFRIVRPDGEIRHLNQIFDVVRNERGEAIRAFGTMQDITERKRAEEASRESQAKLQSIFSAAPAGIGMTIDQNVKELNARLCEMTGYSKAELLGRSISVVYPSDQDYQSTRREIYRQLEEKGNSTAETCWRRKDGQLIHVLLNCAPLRHGDLSQGITFAVLDITERKKAEEKIKAEKEFSEKLVSTANAVIVGLDKNHRILLFSKGAERITGYRAEEVTGKDWFKVFFKDEMYHQMTEVWNDAWGKDAHTYTNPIHCKHGKEIIAQWSNTSIKDEAGRPLMLLCIAIDITERKRAEEALRESEERYRTYVENAPDGIFITGSDVRYIDVNQAACRMTGYSRDELLDMSIMQLAPSGPSPEALESFEELKRNGRSDSDIVIRRKDGSLMYASLHAVALSNGRYMGFCSDITEHKQAEEALRESEERIRTLADASFEAIVIHEDGVLLQANDQFFKMFGYGKDELLGRKIIPRLIAPESVDLVQSRIVSGSTETYEVVAMKKDGTSFPAEIQGRSLEYYGRTVRVATMRDLSERKKMGDQLIQAERLAAVGTLAYGIAHEFNNIIAGILGNAEYGMGNQDRREVEECFRVIMENCDRARSITNNLLAFAGRRQAKKETSDIMESVLGLMERELQKENIRVTRNFHPVPEIFCDPGELSEVFLNMITNARDAMRPNGGKLAVSMGRMGDDLQITFADTGCGIPDAIKGRIFEPFVTTKGALGQSEIPGTGLGLFLSIGVISGYHGRIEVESREGRGSTFTISIPASENQLPPDGPQDSPEKTVPMTRSLRILLIDDEEPICTAAKNGLEADGHSVVSTTSGKKGLELFRSRAFDLVLSDITMPDMDGIKLMSTFKAEDPKVKLIAVTGHVQEDRLAAAERAGADQILTKPFKKEDLLQAIGRVMSSEV